ncbi:tellurite resistance/C4-dicarboxylate transporter family protein [Mucilaginibacter rubeus]|uniref:tellurite resistance/C4-dicarboxylate transporter family protein n=1 Tax=Mucilaginibacter rubeus TaxID=2027860 RepID=UPI001662D45D|nr:tellurite resistance/C4-dicarboxylate transporter family protein [Mucilaginibacter rubeus]
MEAQHTALPPKPGEPITGHSLQTFFPGYFALVMATGIVSVGAFLYNMKQVANILLCANVIFYIVLWAVLIFRAIKYPTDVWKDISSSSRGVTFLTIVAANNVLGNQFGLMTSYKDVAIFLWEFGIVLWVMITYTFFIVITAKEPKQGVEASLSGAWLLIVVATESVAVLGAIIAGEMVHKDVIIFISFCAFLIGAMHYMVFISLIIYRWLFISMKAELLTPPYWINMGAVAITTLAGSRLLMYSHNNEWISGISYFLPGLTVFFWAFATWWIPILFLLPIWRHIIQKVPVKYDPQYWSLVFPAGMYAVATFNFSKALDLPFILPISNIFIYFSITAWVIVFAGMLREFIRFLYSEKSL